MNYIDDIDVRDNQHKKEYYYWECQELVIINYIKLLGKGTHAFKML